MNQYPGAVKNYRTCTFYRRLLDVHAFIIWQIYATNNRIVRDDRKQCWSQLHNDIHVIIEDFELIDYYIACYISKTFNKTV